jgi:hypothetical protein
MVKLSKKAVEAFQKLMLEERGVKLSYEYAEIMAVEWLEFVKFFCTPIRKETDGETKQS